MLILVDPASGCVTARGFLEQVRSRTPRAREAESGESARRFRVTIEGSVPVVGRLLAENTDGTTAVREVQGTSCQEVADALALVVAVTLDPLADQSPGPGNTRAYRPGRAPRSSGAAAPHPSVRTTHAPRRPEPMARWRHALGGEALVRAWLVDESMPGLGARYWGSLANDAAAGLLVTVGAFATFAADAQAESPASEPDRYVGGVIRYHLLGLDAGACPFGASLGARVRLYPCGAFTLGQLRAQGQRQLPGAQSDSTLFVAAALEGRWIIHIAGPLGLVGAVGLSVPLQKKYSLVMTTSGNEQPVGSTRPVGFVGALGLLLSTL
ncbi:MAG: hypothetical protein JW940_20430 [Polyangiaceae bacterium]|nr:hypothetical protein [Polyangiaceae bacterium]